MDLFNLQRLNQGHGRLAAKDFGCLVYYTLLSPRQWDILSGHSVYYTRSWRNHVGKLPRVNKVCFCFPFPFLPLGVEGSDSGPGGDGGDGGCTEGPCPQAGCTGSVSPRMFLSDLFPEINSFGGLFDAAAGNSGKADLDKEGGGGVFLVRGWGLMVELGCCACGRKPLLESCPLLVHGIPVFRSGREGAEVGFGGN